MQARPTFAALVLLGAALDSSALTLGRPQGGAWIGKPLDLVVPLQLDSAEPGGSLCLEAEVTQGDIRLDEKRITLSLDPGSSPDTPRVRLRTTRAIEEPVVQVRLSAGCATKSTRQFTLLADLPPAAPVLPSAPAAAAVAQATGGLASNGQAGGDAGQGGGAAVPGRTAQGATSAADARRRADIAAGAEAPPPRPRPRPAPRPAAPRPAASADAGRPATPPRPAPVAKAPAPAPAAAAPSRAAAPQIEPPESEAPRSQAPVSEAPQPAGEGRPRLRIEALEPGPTPAPALRAGPDAATAQNTPAASPLPAPSAGAPASAAAGAAGAGALAGGAGAAVAPAATSVQTDAQRLQALEETLAALREEQARNQKLLLQMQVQLAQAQAAQAQAQAERWRNPLVYLLLGLLVLALLGLVLAWRSAQRAREALWWSTGEGGAARGNPRRDALPRQGVLARDEDDDEEEDDDEDDDVRRPVARRTRKARIALPEDEEEEDEDDGADALRPAVLVDPAHARHVNTEELMDVRQKSEFFLSLGQHEQAIAVLREHIEGSAGTSPMAYLDLLRVFHQLGRRDDYARLGAEFEHAFNARVPAFDAYTDRGRGLDQYPGAMARIAAVWGTAATLPLIEELVFRKPGEPGEVFDLPAYQELLMLYGVASESPAPDAGRVEPIAPSVTPPGWLAEGGPAVGAKDPAVPSIYGTLDPDVYPDTEPMSRLPTMPHEVAPVPSVPPETEIPTLDMELADLDRTEFQTLRAPIETPPAPAPAPAPDPHLIDFDPFDPEVEDQIQPRKYVIKR